MKWFSIDFYNYKFNIYDNSYGLLQMTYDTEEVKDILINVAKRNFTVRDLIALQGRQIKKVIRGHSWVEILMEFYTILREEYGDIFTDNIKIICVSEPKIGKVDFNYDIQ